MCWLLEMLIHKIGEKLFMLKAEYPYIPPRSKSEGEADFLVEMNESLVSNYGICVIITQMKIENYKWRVSCR
jgi:hypothetical protein